MLFKLYRLTPVPKIKRSLFERENVTFSLIFHLKSIPKRSSNFGEISQIACIDNN